MEKEENVNPPTSNSEHLQEKKSEIPIETKDGKSDVRIESISYSRIVEYKDGKTTTTSKGVKRVNDDWFTLKNNEWEPSTKEAALESEHTPEEEPSCPRCRKRESQAYYLNWSPFLSHPLLSRFSNPYSLGWW